MRRRDFIMLSGGVAVWPLAAQAQLPAMPVIGYLDAGGLAGWLEAFQRGLTDLGYVEGRNVVIAQRSGRADQLPALAAELVRLHPKVIVVSGSLAAVAAKNATATIPIVIAFATDPIGLGLVTSLARPDGNITGQSNQAPGLIGKRLQLLAEMVSGMTRAGVVWTPSFAANQFDFKEMQAAAATLRLALESFEVARTEDFDAAFNKASVRSGGVAVLSGPLIFRNRDLVVATAMRHKVPAIYYDAEYAESGGLVSYGPSILGMHRNAAVFVDKILKGAKPAELPIEQPTRFEFVINKKTANALGFTIPSSLLLRADRVIE